MTSREDGIHDLPTSNAVNAHTVPVSPSATPSNASTGTLLPSLPPTDHAPNHTLSHTAKVAIIATVVPVTFAVFVAALVLFLYRRRIARRERWDLDLLTEETASIRPFDIYNTSQLASQSLVNIPPLTNEDQANMPSHHALYNLMWFVLSGYTTLL